MNSDLKTLKQYLQYVMDRLNHAIKYGDDMRTSTELAMADARHVLNEAIKTYEEAKKNGN